MLLVLSNGGYLAPPDQNPAREELWLETWKRINRFQPGLLAELFPEEAGKPARPRAEKKIEEKKVEVGQEREMDVAVRKGREGVEEKVEESSSEEEEEEVAAKEEGKKE